MLRSYQPTWGTSALIAFIGVVLSLFADAAFSMEVNIDAANKSKPSYSLYSRPDLKSIPPILDGVLSEPVWQQATVIELNYENEPGQGVAASEKPLAYLYEDSTHLHVAIKAFDTTPEAIRTSLRERDNIELDDQVGIIVDTFNDGRSGFGFFVNPLGAQADLSQQELDDKDGSKDFSWDAIWYSAGSINDEGYIVEMSIPFRALRFPAGGGELTWNIALQRKIPRAHLIELANYRDDKKRKCTLCQYEPLVGFKGIKAGRNIQVTPTLTLGRTDAKDIEHNTGWQQGDLNDDIGVDLRWGISQNRVLNATLNPDFSQVETDAAQLDINNTYALYYDEKRPFFLDGADYLTTPLFNFVHTRNIADPDYGVKLTGKTGSHRYGVMVTNDNRTDFLIPGNQGSELAQTTLESTVAIARYRADIGDKNNLGVLLTSRNGDDYSNRLLAVDGVMWLNQSSSVNYQLAHSDTRNPQVIQTNFDLKESQQGNAYVLSINHQTNTLNLAANVERVDRDFRADLGFQEKVNYQALSLTGEKTWFVNDRKWLTNYSLYADWDKSWDLNGTLLEEELELSGQVEGAMQSTVALTAIHRNSLYEHQYFQEQQVTLWIETTPVRDVKFSTFMRFGDQIDYANAQLGEQFKIDSSINWQLNQHLQVELKYDYSYLDIDDQELYNAGVLDAKFIWQFNQRSQLRLIMQHTDIERNTTLYNTSGHIESQEKFVSTQVLYSYKINPQTLFYFGCSDSQFENDKQQLIRTDRTLFAKFSYAWQY